MIFFHSFLFYHSNLTDEEDIEEQEDQLEPSMANDEREQMEVKNVDDSNDVVGFVGESEMMKSLGLPTSFASSKAVDKKENKVKHDNLKKYYKKKYSLFSKFDQGIKMDTEAWYSVTPEKLARYIAKRCIKKDTFLILDPFCGVGGNSIAFAFVSNQVQVIAVDINPAKVEMAKHNAKIYGVENRINFIVDDFFNVVNYLPLKVDFVFLSPPWGGPDYAKAENFALSMMNPDGRLIFELSKQFISPNIAFFLPKNISLEEMNSLLCPGENCEVEENHVNHKIKAITAYFGNLIDPKLIETSVLN